MARSAKKENTLTLEEKLNQALVPESEQPYQVPKNWCWTKLSYLLTPSKETTEDFSDSSIKYIGLENIEKNIGIISYNTSIGIKSLKNVFSSGQILYGKLRPYLNKHAIANFDGICSTDILVFETKRIVLKEYVNFYFNLPNFIEYAVANSKGINLPRVSESAILNAQIPFPPIAEQKRIVDCIESLFAKLDEAKSKAQAVIDSFEDRKAAILHKAFSGELTERWRKKQARLLTTWKKVVIQDECEKITCGNTPTEFISTSGEIPFLKVYNIVDNKVDFESKPQFIPESVHKERLSSSILLPNDVIMNIVGPPLRKIAIVPNTYPAWNMNQAIVRFRPKETLNYRFLYYSLLNPETLDDVINATKGVVGQANISISQSRNLTIVLPLLDEQMEIVRILDELLTHEQEAKDIALQVIEQIDMIKKSILARAFRGELGTNDPTDESAVELLKSLL